MLRHTFCHLPGIGAKTELRLWAAGLTTRKPVLAQEQARPDPLARRLPASDQVYVGGKAPDGRWAGLKTTVVETWSRRWAGARGEVPGTAARGPSGMIGSLGRGTRRIQRDRVVGAPEPLQARVPVFSSVRRGKRL